MDNEEKNIVMVGGGIFVVIIIILISLDVFGWFIKSLFVLFIYVVFFMIFLWFCFQVYRYFSPTAKAEYEAKLMVKKLNLKTAQTNFHKANPELVVSESVSKAYEEKKQMIESNAVNSVTKQYDSSDIVDEQILNSQTNLHNLIEKKLDVEKLRDERLLDSSEIEFKKANFDVATNAVKNYKNQKDLFFIDPTTKVSASEYLPQRTSSEEDDFKLKKQKEEWNIQRIVSLLELSLRTADTKLARLKLKMVTTILGSVKIEDLDPDLLNHIISVIIDPDKPFSPEDQDMSLKYKELEKFKIESYKKIAMSEGIKAEADAKVKKAESEHIQRKIDLNAKLKGF